MENMKKVWEKPRLTVLVRSRPEETVLSACKVGLFVPSFQTQNFSDCYLNGCPACNTISST